MDADPAIIIALCAYNEEAAIGRLLQNFAEISRERPWRVIFVDDASSDRTYDAAAPFQSKMPIELIRHQTNKGLGASLREIFNRLRPDLGFSDAVVTLDADGTHPAAMIPAMVQMIHDGRADLVIASRFAGEGSGEIGMPLLRSRVASMARAIFRYRYRLLGGIGDLTCGFRAYRGDFIKRILENREKPLSQNGFGIQLEILLRAAVLDARVREIPLMLDYGLKRSASGFRWARSMADYTKLLMRG